MKDKFVIGFMLFAIFFGAGNLIFPPQLGFYSGDALIPAVLGFVVTGVGLPLLGIVAGALVPGGYRAALQRIHPAFALVFLTAAYLAIGPFFGIPRTGTTAYEMAVVPFLGQDAPAGALLAWTLGYFGLAYWLSLNPSRMVDRIGELLTPALLLALLALVVRAAGVLGGNPAAPTAEAYAGGQAFFKGFTEGYLTLDAVGALAFSLVVVTAIQARGEASRQEVVRQSVGAGVIAATALGLIYAALAWIGNHMVVDPAALAELDSRGQNLGTHLLTAAAQQTFGDFGRVLLGVIVTLACLTTTVGLLVAVSEYLSGTFRRLPYRAVLTALTLVAVLIANQGLSAVIAMSVPVLLVIYPIVITLIALVLLARLWPTPRLGWQLAAAAVTAVSLLTAVHAQGWATLPWLDTLPLRAQSLEWLPFMLAGLGLGSLLGARGERVSYRSADVTGNPVPTAGPQTEAS